MFYNQVGLIQWMTIFCVIRDVHLDNHYENIDVHYISVTIRTYLLQAMQNVSNDSIINLKINIKYIKYKV